MYNNTDRKHIPMENRKEGPAIGNNISLGSFLLFFFFFFLYTFNWHNVPLEVTK